MKYLFLYFFFSSRRRHTRSKRDWSSDVCSSDLFKSGNPDGILIAVTQLTSMGERDVKDEQKSVLKLEDSVKHYAGLRSEERRVGKECRSRWAREAVKKQEEDRKG